MQRLRFWTIVTAGEVAAWRVKWEFCLRRSLCCGAARKLFAASVRTRRALLVYACSNRICRRADGRGPGCDADRNHGSGTTAISGRWPIDAGHYSGPIHIHRALLTYRELHGLIPITTTWFRIEDVADPMAQSPRRSITST